MASKTHFFTGKAYWAKLEEPDQKYKYWGINVSLDDVSKEEFKKSGLQMETRVDKKDGFEFVTFRRPVKKLIKDELVDFEKPIIVDKDNNVMTDRPLIGNGSSVTVKVLVYDSIKGKGHRLEGVRINDLVEYQGGTSNEEAPF